MQAFVRQWCRARPLLPLLSRRVPARSASAAAVPEPLPVPAPPPPTETAKQVLRPAAPTVVAARHHQLVCFAELREEIARSFTNEEAMAGVKFHSLPSFTSVLKGHRAGELTVFTGSTGVGKTTFLTQMALDLCQHSGVPTLFGSFEIKNSRVARTMLTQMAGGSVADDPALFEETADRLAALPMHFLRYFGSADVDRVIEALEYAVREHRVAHVVIDNLQFMLGAVNKGTEKFDAQDNAIAKFRRFASEHDVHITLVIHPRKLIGGELLSTQSIFGTAKATQEADNVIILQTHRAFRFLDVCKNRFDGQLGIVPLRFHPERLAFSEWQPRDMPAGERAAIDHLVKYNGFPVKHLDFGTHALPAAPKLTTRTSVLKDSGPTMFM